MSRILEKCHSIIQKMLNFIPNVKIDRITENRRHEMVARVDPAELEFCHPYYTKRRKWPLGERVCVFHLREDGLEYYEKP